MNNYLNPRGFFYILYSLSTKDSFIIVILNLFASLTESVGFTMLLPILKFSGMGQSISEDNSYASLFKFLPSNISLELLIGMFSAILCIFAVLSYYRSIIVNKAEWRITCLEQEKLFSSIAKAKWSKVLTQRKSDLNELLMREVRQVGFAYVQSSSMISAFLNFAFLTAIACYISLPSTLLSLCLGIFIIIITRPLNRQVIEAGKDSYPAYQELFAKCDAHIEGLPLIKVFNATNSYIENFVHACHKLSDITKSFISARAKTALLYRVCVALSLGLSAYISIRYVFLTIPEFIVLGALFSRIVPQLLVLHHSYQTFLNCIPSFLAINEAIEYFDKNSENRENYADSSLSISFNLKKGISFKNVSYCYSQSADKNALESISVDLVSKGVVSITGPSGSGKSTFACILAGLLSPTSGTVHIGSDKLNESTMINWRQHIGYVPQETILPYSTLRQSLLLAKPNASDDELWDILDKVSLRKVIENQSLKLDSLLGDKGCMLSGGERQRLSIARALLNCPEVIILDEATNSLDKETEEAIFLTLESYRKSSLIIIISHNEITKLCINQKLAIDQGMLIEYQL